MKLEMKTRIRNIDPYLDLCIAIIREAMEDFEDGNDKTFLDALFWFARLGWTGDELLNWINSCHKKSDTLSKQIDNPTVDWFIKETHGMNKEEFKDWMLQEYLAESLLKEVEDSIDDTPGG